jgi:hypothetical protein
MKRIDKGDRKPAPKTIQRQGKNHEITYNVSKINQSNKGALIDRGANGGIAGSDVRIISKSDRAVNITGIDDHEMKNIPIGTVGAVVKSQRGEVIAIMHQYAIVGCGKSIHSSVQLEDYKNDVNDRSMKIKGGLQCIMTLDGYLHPINIVDGLPYTPMRPYTDDEWKKLPHVVWTSDVNWDPSVVDNYISDDNKWFRSLPKDEGKYLDDPFNMVGDYIYGEPGWRNENPHDSIYAMVYDLTDLNAQDTFDHENMVFSKDLMLYDEGDDEYEIIDYYDDILV